MIRTVRRRLIPVALALSVAAVVLGHARPAEAAPTATVTWLQNDTHVYVFSPWASCQNIVLPDTLTATVPLGQTITVDSPNFWCSSNGITINVKIRRQLRYDANGFTTANYQMIGQVDGGGPPGVCTPVAPVNGWIRTTIKGPRPEFWHPEYVNTGSGWKQMLCGWAGIITFGWGLKEGFRAP